ncbi:MAG: hypothetical protein AAFV96_05060 [Pseudomonadota bacterium]
MSGDAWLILPEVALIAVLFGGLVWHLRQTRASRLRDEEEARRRQQDEGRET